MDCSFRNFECTADSDELGSSTRHSEIPEIEVFQKSLLAVRAFHSFENGLRKADYGALYVSKTIESIKNLGNCLF